MLIRRAFNIPTSEITPEPIFRARRALLRTIGLTAAGTFAPAAWSKAEQSLDFSKLTKSKRYRTAETLTTFEAASTYNNFYEFGTDKDDPARNATEFNTAGWQVEVGGHCERGGTFSVEDLVKPTQIEERVYRFRCVEAWSMVIPWVGVSLAEVLKRFEPNSKAKYVAFTTLMDPERMPGQRVRALDWPYREGLRIDEAMHPLAFLVVGMYGKVLPNQNGAPLRLMCPWKYGFKNIKSIVKIEFVERQPFTSWNDAAPHEYGFYANVNPAVDHPRWSQASERRLAGSERSLFAKRIATLPFNGYAEDVAGLYQGMDLSKFY
jgi:sulfoxide reductase catalytic subunit YedY